VVVTIRETATEIDLDRVEIRRDGTLVPVQPQVFDVIEYLLRHPARVVTKIELLDNVWGDRFVSESALTSRIKSARRALGDDGVEQRVIKTVHGRGYRWVAEVIPASSTRPITSRAERVAEVDGERPAPATLTPMVGRHTDLATVIAAVAGGRGALVTGADRSGKSAVLDEVAREFWARGQMVSTVTGWDASAHIPLASVAHLLPDTVDITTDRLPDDLARTALWRTASDALAGPDDGEAPVIVVDDADHVDPLSSALLTSLATDDRVLLVVAHRTGAITNFGTLASRGLLDTVVLRPLDEVDVDAFLTRRLGGPIDLESLRTLTRESGGVPGVLIDIVETSVAAGTLVDQGGVWRLTAEPVSSRSIEWPPDGIGDDAMGAAERLALADPLPLDLAGELVGDELLDVLDASRLISLSTARGEATVRLADAALRRTVLASIPPLRRRRHVQALVSGLDTSTIGPQLLVNVLDWDTDVEVPTADVAAAATFALLAGDRPSAEALAHRLDRTEHPVRSVIEADVAIELGQYDRAERALAEIDVERLGEVAEAIALRQRSSVDFVHHGRRDATLTWLESERDRRRGLVARSLESRRLGLMAAVHRYDDVLREVSTDASDAFDEPMVRAERNAAVAYALAGQGRFHDALASIDRVELDLAEVAAPWRADVADSMYVLRCTSLQQLGRIQEACELVRRELPFGEVPRHGFLPAVGADIELGAGRPRAARELLRPARTNMRRHLHPHYAALMDVMSARCELALGHRDVAERLLADAQAQLDRSSGAAHTRVLAWTADAYRMIGRDGRDLRLGERAGRLEPLGATLSEMELRCALVDLDRTPVTARRELERIEAVAGSFDGDLWQLRVAYVRARAETTGFDEVRRGFESIGAIRLANVVSAVSA
jgi:DNA-binding winged helix-turn-helix (wHTH) protein